MNLPKPWMMPKPNLVVFVVLLGLALYDLALVCFFDTTSSISAFMVASGFKSPLLVFTCGCLAGHLFFYVKQDDGTGRRIFIQKKSLNTNCGHTANAYLTDFRLNDDDVEFEEVKNEKKN